MQTISIGVLLQNATSRKVIEESWGICVSSAIKQKTQLCRANMAFCVFIHKIGQEMLGFFFKSHCMKRGFWNSMSLAKTCAWDDQMQKATCQQSNLSHTVTSGLNSSFSMHLSQKRSLVQFLGKKTILFYLHIFTSSGHNSTNYKC